MRAGGDGEARGKVKGTSSTRCWGLENRCGAERMKNFVKEPCRYLDSDL